MSLEERTIKFIKELRDHHGYDSTPIVEELIDDWELNLSTLGVIKRDIKDYLRGKSKGVVGDAVEANKLLWKIYDS